MAESPRYAITHSKTLGRILKKLKRRDAVLFQEFHRGVEKIAREPTLGKPLRNALRNLRRIHIGGSFVLLYEIENNRIRLIDFDHHDKIYEKYA